MPEPFERCRRRGGKIRTETLSGDRYRHVCYLGGKKFLGHVEKKKQAQPGKALAKRVKK